MTKLYWIYDETCSNPLEHGYIGITDVPLATRWRAHANRGTVPRNSNISQMFEGTREECKCWEFAYRPDPDIGWNKAIGGYGGGMLRRKHSAETRAKMAEKRREYHATHDFRQSETAKAAISATLTGKAKPESQRVKLRELAKRRFRVTREDGSWTWGYRDQNE